MGSFSDFMSASSIELLADKCPTDELSYTNCAIIHEKDLDPKRVRYFENPSHLSRMHPNSFLFRHIELSSKVTPSKYVFTIKKYDSIRPGRIAFNVLQVRLFTSSWVHESRRLPLLRSADGPASNWIDRIRFDRINSIKMSNRFRR